MNVNLYYFIVVDNIGWRENPDSPGNYRAVGEIGAEQLAFIRNDLALIPPATDHTVANEDPEPLCLLSVQAPAVSVEETFGRQTAAVAGYDEDDDEY